jgi:hypothetical protein
MLSDSGFKPTLLAAADGRRASDTVDGNAVRSTRKPSTHFVPRRRKVRIPYYRHHGKRCQPMTICAAAICKNGQENVLVTISDRMITVGDETEFESGATKIFGFSPVNVICLSAGDADASLEIANATHRQVEAKGTLDVGGVADLYAENHAALRRTRLERLYLAPLGLNLGTFMARQRKMDPEQVAYLTDRMLDASGDLRAEAIIVGVDSTGPHIYQVADPGTSVCRDKSGFFAIGGGSRHFETVFMSASYDSTWQLMPTLLLMFSAKRQAEMAPGVGRATDMLSMQGNGNQVLTQEQLRIIATHHDNLIQRTIRAREEVIQALTRDFTAAPGEQGSSSPS